MKLEKAKAHYKKIISSIKKNKDICFFDTDMLERQAKGHLFCLELKEVYGLNLQEESLNYSDWIKIRCNLDCHIVTFTDTNGKKISIPDFGEQPKNETLLKISFSTGAYIFGQDYPTGTFNKFFNELNSYNPKYSDSRNRDLYFELSKSKDVFNNLMEIYKKYLPLAEKEVLEVKRAKLQSELDKLGK